MGMDIKYLVRVLNPASGLRIGLSSKSFETCLKEHAKDMPEQERKKLLKECETNIFGYSFGYNLKYNVPIKSMVGRAAKSVDEVYDNFVEDDKIDVIAEIKYDGERT